MSRPFAPLRWCISLLLLSPTLALFADTIDLLSQENRELWLTLSGKPGKIRLQSSDKANGLKISREDGSLENTALLAYFDRKGILPQASTKAPEVTLSKIGDSLGVRTVLSYNPGARYHIYSQTLRLALGNSQNTRLPGHSQNLASPLFADDSGWVAVIGVDAAKSSFLRRTPASKTSFPGTTVGTTLEKEWTSTIAKSVFQAGNKVEIVFSLTRTGPDSLRLYGFVQGVEQEHAAKGVADFSFDSLCLYYPVPRTNTPAEITLHELQVVTLP